MKKLLKDLLELFKFQKYRIKSKYEIIFYYYHKKYQPDAKMLIFHIFKNDNSYKVYFKTCHYFKCNVIKMDSIEQLKEFIKSSFAKHIPELESK